MSLKKSTGKVVGSRISSAQLLDEQLENCVWLPGLVWAFRFYGVELCHQNPSRCRVCAYCLLTSWMVMIQLGMLIILIFLVALLLSNSIESMFLYSAVPVLSVVLSSIVSYIILLTRRAKLRAFLNTIFLKLRTIFRKSPLSIRNEIRRNESCVILGFFLLFVVQMIQRVASTLTRFPPKSLANLTLFDVEIDFDSIKPYTWVVQIVALNIHLFDVLTISLLIIVCQLLLICFRHIDNYLLEESSELDSLESGNCAKIRFQKFYRLHREACMLVDEAQEIFAPFILLWCATQVLNACFWIRSMKFAYMRTIPSTGMVVLHLICSGIPFTAITFFAIRVNDKVSSTLRAFTHKMLGENDDKFTKCFIYHTLYVSNYIMAPVCFNGLGFFTLNKGFVLTILGTVLTYTLVLYGLD